MSTRKKGFPVLKKLKKKKKPGKKGRRRKGGKKEVSVSEKLWWEFGASGEGWTHGTSLCVSQTVSSAA